MNGRFEKSCESLTKQLTKKNPRKSAGNFDLVTGNFLSGAAAQHVGDFAGSFPLALHPWIRYYV
jgi:hypothetical protein